MNYMEDATKLLLDRIISWEKDLSEYPSLESILREQFIILERTEDDLSNAILDGTSTIEQDRQYLINEGLDPDELAEQGVVFVKTLMDKINLQKQVEELTKELDASKAQLDGLTKSISAALAASEENERLTKVNEEQKEVIRLLTEEMEKIKLYMAVKNGRATLSTSEEHYNEIKSLLSKLK